MERDVVDQCVSDHFKSRFKPLHRFTSNRSPLMWGQPSEEASNQSLMVAGERRAYSKEVLILEDEANLSDLIADVLESEGHQAWVATNGREGVAYLRQSTPDLILLDLMMPVMDGWEFMRALRANPAWRDIPVVIITAIYDIKRTQQEIGARAVITKPFDIEQLTQIVDRFAR